MPDDCFSGFATGPHAGRMVWVCGDGDYSNSTLLPHLPSKTAYIGRTRSDLNLHGVPKQPRHRSAGRPRSYGKQLPTPEELRKDKTVPWGQLAICNGPKATKVRYKRISQAKWHVAGEKAVVQIVVIAPLRYRKRKNGPWLYTKPAYLVCTDADIPVEQLIQACFWRWGIEVNFKEEKQLFGAGPKVQHFSVNYPASLRVSISPAISSLITAVFGGVLNPAA